MVSNVINVRQIGSYPQVTVTGAADLLLLQQGGLGGPYNSIAPADLIASVLSGGGTTTLTSDGLTFTFNAPVAAPSFNASVIGASSITAREFVQDGSPVASVSDMERAIACVFANSVTSFNQRSGEVQLEDVDILRAGGALQANPHFTGYVTAPSVWNPAQADDTVATTNWVQRAMCAFLESWLELQQVVFSFNARAGNITLTAADINSAWIAGTVPVLPAYTVATLPAAPVLGAQACVTDGAAALAWGASVTGGGTSVYLVWFNGTAWTVVGQ